MELGQVYKQYPPWFVSSLQVISYVKDSILYMHCYKITIVLFCFFRYHISSSNNVSEVKDECTHSPTVPGQLICYTFCSNF